MDVRQQQSSQPVPRALRVVVVDDSAVYRHGIVRALQRDRRFEVVGFFEDGDVAGIAALKYDVALVDYLLETTTGLELHADLRRAGVTAPTVIISASLTDEVRAHARRLGIRRTLDKTLPRRAILDALVEVGRRTHSTSV